MFPPLDRIKPKSVNFFLDYYYYYLYIFANVLFFFYFYYYCYLGHKNNFDQRSVDHIERLGDCCFHDNDILKILWTYFRHDSEDVPAPLCLIRLS